MGDRYREHEVELEGGEEGPAPNGQAEGEKSEAQLKHENAVMVDLVRSAGGPLMKMKVHRIREEDEEPMDED